MVEALSEERLDDLRQMRTDIMREPRRNWGMSYLEDIVDAVNEIDRLKAEILAHSEFCTHSWQNG